MSEKPDLLTPADPPAFTWVNPQGKAPILLVCDHASPVIPLRLGDLGLPEAERLRHIGWDIGAAAMTRWLARALDAPGILTGFSRLVVDCNRPPERPGFIPASSDDTVIPGNQDLSETERAARLAACFMPYQNAISDHLDRLNQQGIVPILLSIHSFTPEMAGFCRPWQIGILWDRDPRLPLPLLDRLRAEPGLMIGDNEPYTARDPDGYTLEVHAAQRGLAHVLIEFRQNEIDSAEGIDRFGQIFLRAIRPILDDPEIYVVRKF